MRPKNKEQASEWGKRSAKKDHDSRLYAALNFEPIRHTEPVLIFEVRTFNPVSGQRHLIELKHELRNGNDRYNLYIDGKCQRNQWSRWGFVTLMFRKIESVRVDHAQRSKIA